MVHETGDAGEARSAPRHPRFLSLFKQNVIDLLGTVTPLTECHTWCIESGLNIPVEIARAQGHHGAKGALHGSKGGRPRLDLSEAERAARRALQKRESRERAKGVSVAPAIPADRVDIDRAKRIARDVLRSLSLRVVPGVSLSPRSKPSPVAAVVGQNSPCPCGSGRKFKKCCRG